jgi:hypothetical protein
MMQLQVYQATPLAYELLADLIYANVMVIPPHRLPHGLKQLME